MLFYSLIQSQLSNYELLLDPLSQILILTQFSQLNKSNPTTSLGQQYKGDKSLNTRQQKGMAEQVSSL